MRSAAIATALVLCALAALAGDVQRPTFEVTTSETFDAAEIPVYPESHDAIYAHIDANLDDHVAALQRWVRQRSVSAQNIGIQEMAEMLRSDLEALGFTEAKIVPTGGHPGVWGFYDAGAAKTLLIYMMYDVQPVDPEDWRTPPFEGNLVETELGTVLMARGATNQKGPERALLNAIDSILAVDGTLPVNLMITAEGEEEIGSVHYPEIVDRYEERLRNADGAFFPINSQSGKGRLTMSLGVKGIIYFELEAVGGPQGGPRNAEIHGSYKAIVDAPALRLVQAIASLTSEDGNTILVPGYYDDIRPPTMEEQRLMNGMLDSWSDADLKGLLAVDRWVDGKEGIDTVLDYLYMPTLNVDGIWGGYTETGAKTILPHKATAKLDSRLPPSIDPHEAMQKIRDHLRSAGFDDIVVREMEAYPAAQSSIEDDWVQTAIGVFNKYVEPPMVRPRLAGSAPFYEFTDRLGLPLVFSGLGHGSGAHAPNEYMVIQPQPETGIAGLADLEKAYVDLLFAFAGTSGAEKKGDTGGKSAGKAAASSATKSGALNDELLGRIKAAAAGTSNEMIEIRRNLHMHPELSGQEVKTARLVADHLRQLGLEVETEVGGHGVVGILRGGRPGPVVAYRADMDAVRSQVIGEQPYRSQVAGVKHVCGHDAHVAVGLGVAGALAAVRKDLPGTVKFLFQPAEENVQGAQAMIDDGALENPSPEAIFGVHTTPFETGSVGCPVGVGLTGWLPFTVEVRQGDDLDDTASEMAAALSGLSTVSMDFSPEWFVSLMNGLLEENGPYSQFIYVEMRGITQGDGGKSREISGVIRADGAESYARARRQITAAAGKVAGGGAAHKVTFDDDQFPDMHSDPDLVRAAVGPIDAAIGEGSAIFVHSSAPFFGEDFALFQEHIPGAMFFLGVANEEKGITAFNHFPDYDIDESAIEVGTVAMASVLLDYLRSH